MPLYELHARHLFFDRKQETWRWNIRTTCSFTYKVRYGKLHFPLHKARNLCHDAPVGIYKAHPTRALGHVTPPPSLS